MAQTLRMAGSVRGAESGKTVLATVLFTDIVGSSELAATLGDRRWHELLSKHHAAVRGELERFDGREIDTAGDGFFADFDTPGLAVHCGLAIIETMDTLGLRIRAGSTWGSASGAATSWAGSQSISGHASWRRRAPARSWSRALSRPSRRIGAPLRRSGEPGAAHPWRVAPLRCRPAPRRSRAGAHTDSGLRPDRRDGAGSAARRSATGRQGAPALRLSGSEPATADEPRRACRTLWPEHAPRGADAGLSSILSKLRRILGPDALVGRHTIQLRLAPDAWIDFEAAARPCIGRNRLSPAGPGERHGARHA